MAPNPNVAAIDQSDLPTLEDQILTGNTYGATKLAEEDQWMANLDYEAFKEDIQVRYPLPPLPPQTSQTAQLLRKKHWGGGMGCCPARAVDPSGCCRQLRAPLTP